MVGALEADALDIDWDKLEGQFGGGNFDDDNGGGDDDGDGGEGLPHDPDEGPEGNAWVGGLVVGQTLGMGIGAAGIYAERSWLHAHKATAQPANTIAVEQGLFNTETLVAADIALGIVFAGLGAAIATKIQERRRK